MQRKHYSPRSKNHNQKVIETIYIQISSRSNNQTVHINLLTEHLFVSLKDKDVKLWRCEYAKQGIGRLMEWVRQNLYNHPKLVIRRQMVSRKED